MSKVFEYAIFNQLMSSLIDNHLFCIEQLGFRSGQSTKYATLRLVDYLTNKMDDFKCTYTYIYVDQSKAFDRLNHSILLNKLSHHGISDC